MSGWHPDDRAPFVQDVDYLWRRLWPKATLVARIETRIREIPIGAHIYTEWAPKTLGQHLSPDVIRSIATASAGEALKQHSPVSYWRDWWNYISVAEQTVAIVFSVFAFAMLLATSG